MAWAKSTRSHTCKKPHGPFVHITDCYQVETLLFRNAGLGGRSLLGEEVGELLRRQPLDFAV
jgi:hypothetical protein